MNAADALYKIGNAAAISALIKALGDPVEHVRMNAAGALGNIGEPHRKFPALLTALKDRHHWVRWNAANALGQIGDPAAIPKLKHALNDTVDEGSPTCSSSLA